MPYNMKHLLAFADFLLRNIYHNLLTASVEFNNLEIA